MLLQLVVRVETLGNGPLVPFTITRFSFAGVELDAELRNELLEI